MVMGGIDIGEDYWDELMQEFDADGDGRVPFFFIFKLILNKIKLSLVEIDWLRGVYKNMFEQPNNRDYEEIKPGRTYF